MNNRLRKYEGRSLLRTVQGRPTSQRNESSSDDSPWTQNTGVIQPQSSPRGTRSSKRQRISVAAEDVLVSQLDEDFDRSPDASSDEESIDMPAHMDGTKDPSPRSSVQSDKKADAKHRAGKPEARTGQKRKSDRSAILNNEPVAIDCDAEDEPFFDVFTMSQRPSQTYRSSGYRSTPTTNIHGSQHKKRPSPLEHTKFRHPEPLTARETKTEKKTFRAPHAPLNETTPNKPSNFRQFLYEAPGENQHSPSSLGAKKTGFKFPGSSQASSLTPPPASENLDDLEILDSSAPVVTTGPDGLSTTARCPMCDEEVDRNFLENFNDGQKLRWKDKLGFCTAHKQQSAAEKWSDNKYPTIKWSTFDRRLRKFHKQLTAIVEGRQTSYYRNRLEEKVDSGKNRNVLKNPELSDAEIVVPGYYGHKGSRIMMDHLMAAFSTKIRRVAASDKLMPQIGVSHFIQAVLVPELAVMLVKEDLKVDDEQARVVLKESAEVGDLMHAEEEDRLEHHDEQPETEIEIEHVVID